MYIIQILPDQAFIDSLSSMMQPRVQVGVWFSLSYNTEEVDANFMLQVYQTQWPNEQFQIIQGPLPQLVHIA